MSVNGTTSMIGYRDLYAAKETKHIDNDGEPNSAKNRASATDIFVTMSVD
jgi:hypothetical protein